MIFRGDVINILSRDNTTHLCRVSSFGLFSASLNCHSYTVVLELLFSLQIHCNTSFLFWSLLGCKTLLSSASTAFGPST